MLSQSQVRTAAHTIHILSQHEKGDINIPEWAITYNMLHDAKLLYLTEAPGQKLGQKRKPLHADACANHTQAYTWAQMHWQQGAMAMHCIDQCSHQAHCNTALNAANNDSCT